MIGIELQNDVIEVGKFLSGSFSYTRDSSYNQEKRPYEINLKVALRTEGRGDVDTEIIYDNSFLETTYSTFGCRIPPLGPISYDGELIRVIWEVITEAKFPGIFGGTEKQVKVFQVIPAGA
ncbi:MAG: hypothetical protein AAGJ08_12535 [Cyanobacteria bacterium P01_H01_bin.35]